MDWLITGVGRRARIIAELRASADELVAAGLCGDPILDELLRNVGLADG